MTETPAPTIDALDAGWFTTTLRAGGHLPDDRRVVDAIATQIGEGAGLMSLVWRVTLTYDQPTDAPG